MSCNGRARILNSAKIMFLVLPILLIGSRTVVPQQGASVSLNTGFSQPAYLGQSMAIFVYVQNLASVPMEVMSVAVTTDWYQTLNGNVPRILQAGESSSWKFDNVNIPSSTWTGEHQFDASIMVGWADSSGGWSNTLSSPLKVTTKFAVTQAPSQPAVTIGGPGVPNTIVGPSLPSTNNSDYSGYIAAVILGAILAAALILGIQKAKTKK
jgi:hypothetical protein